MKKLLKERYQSHFIFHFTDKRNWPHIEAAGGLLPRSMLEEVPFIPGGNQQSIEMDDLYGFNDYVHCCFIKDHPMEYRARTAGRIDPIWLRIPVDILDRVGVKYAPGIAIRTGVPIYNNEEAIEELDLYPLFGFLDWHIPEELERRKNAEKYEILIPGKVPIEMIEVL